VRALVLVDIQYDFLPGGALGVPRGDEVLAVASRLIPEFEIVVATQDWHPPGHSSFASSHPARRLYETIEVDGLPQTLWPDHCVQHTHGAELSSDLPLDRIIRVFPKGTNPRIDSYSGFFDNGKRKATGMGDWLREHGVSELSIIGLATDYCVCATAIDAAELGFKTYVILEGCRGVEVQPGDCDRAVAEMRAAGVLVV